MHLYLKEMDSCIFVVSACVNFHMLRLYWREDCDLACSAFGGAPALKPAVLRAAVEHCCPGGNILTNLNSLPTVSPSVNMVVPNLDLINVFDGTQIYLDPGC